MLRVVMTFVMAVPLLADVNTDQLLIGTGFNSAAGIGRGNCVEFDPQESTALATAAGDPKGQKGIYFLEEVTETSRLRQLLHLGVSASFGWPPFDGDATYDFLSSGTFNHYRNFLIIHVKVTLASEILRRKRLTGPALANATEMPRFFRYCGDQFVYGRTKGGELSAIVELTSSDETERQNVSGGIRAAIADFGNTAADFNRSIERIKSLKTSRIIMLRKGPATDFPDLQGLRQASLRFPSDVAKLSGIETLLTEQYFSVENLPEKITNFDFVLDQSKSLSELAERLEQAYRIRGDIKYVQAHPEEFAPGSVDKVTPLWATNEGMIKNLIFQAAKCRDNYTECKLDPPPSFPKMPERREFGLVWKDKGGDGQPFSQSFQTTFPGTGGDGRETHRHGKFALTPEPDGVQARITRVAYRCEGEGCGWSYGETTGYVADYAIVDNRTAFTFRRKYQSPKSVREVYVAYYERLERTCIKNCN